MQLDILVVFAAFFCLPFVVVTNPVASLIARKTLSCDAFHDPKCCDIGYDSCNDYDPLLGCGAGQTDNCCNKVKDPPPELYRVSLQAMEVLTGKSANREMHTTMIGGPDDAPPQLVVQFGLEKQGECEEITQGVQERREIEGEFRCASVRSKIEKPIVVRAIERLKRCYSIIFSLSELRCPSKAMNRAARHRHVRQYLNWHISCSIHMFLLTIFRLVSRVVNLLLILPLKTSLTSYMRGKK